MIKLLFFIFALSLTGFVVQDSFAQTVPDFVTEIPNDISPPETTTSSIDSDVAFVNINLDALSEPSMSLSIFGDTLTIIHEETIFRNSTDYTYIGSTNDQKYNVFIAVLNDKAYLELTSPQQNYELSFDNNSHKIQKFTELVFNEDDPLFTNTELNELSNSFVYNPTFHEDSPITDTLVDVTFFYTDAALNARSSTIMRQMATLGVDKANLGFNLSDIPVQLVYDGIDRLDRYAESGNMQTDLNRLINPNDGHLDQGPIIRDQLDADIGLLITHHPNSGQCGLASQILADEDNAFAIASENCILIDDRNAFAPVGTLIAHEIGHLMGARHQILSDPTITPFKYGHAYYDFPNGKVTIMGTGICSSCTWENIWSNPNVSFFGSSNVAGEAEFANNARVLSATAPYVASFRGDETYTAPPQYPAEIFVDDFGPGLGLWKLSSNTNVNWFVDDSREGGDPPFFPNDPNHNIAVGEECGICSITTADTFDLTGYENVYLNFFYVIGERLNNNEGLKVEISKNDGNSWSELFYWNENNGDNLGKWEEIKDLQLDSSFLTDEFKLRFTAIHPDGSRDAVQVGLVQILSYKLTDDEDPTITVPPNFTTEATAISTPLTQADYGTAIASDNIDPNPSITDNAPATFPLGDTIITWTATDASGNSATTTQTITIVDTTIPNITAPADQTFEATGIITQLTTSDFGTATATDIFIPVTIDSDLPLQFPLGDTIITWFATDANDLTNSTTQIITLQDTTEPTVTITNPATSTTFAFGDTINFSATANDIVDGDISTQIQWSSDIDGDFDIGANISTSILSVNNHIITASVTDNAGKTGDTSITIIVEDASDTEDPIITITSPATNSTFTYRDTINFSATANDNLDGDISTQIQWSSDRDGDLGTGASIPDVADKLGDHIITASATDNAGNNATDSITITVNDLADYEYLITSANDDVTQIRGTQDINDGGYVSITNNTTTGLRFTDISVPANETFRNAYLEIHEVLDRNGDITFIISSEDSATPADYEFVLPEQRDFRVAVSAGIVTQTWYGGNSYVLDVTDNIKDLLDSGLLVDGGDVSLILTVKTPDAERLISNQVDGESEPSHKLIVHFGKRPHIIDDQAPDVLVTSPEPSSFFNPGETITFSVDISDKIDTDFEDKDIVWMFRTTADTTRLSPLGTGNNLEISNFTSNVYAVKAFVTDDAGNEGSDGTWFTINGEASPIAQITSPSNKDVFSEGEAITFTGTAMTEADNVRWSYKVLDENHPQYGTWHGVDRDTFTTVIDYFIPGDYVVRFTAHVGDFRDTAFVRVSIQ